MTAPTNVITSATPNVGVREDLEDVVYLIAPEERPLTSSAASVKATNILHEWQIRSLAAPSATNAKLEGDDVGTLDAGNLTTRVGNYCQILEKTGGVSGTQQAVKLAGRADELDEQKLLKGRELLRDFEMRAVGNYASVAESGATTRKLGGVLAWATSNVSRGSGGSSGGFSAGIVAAATNGTQRTLTESLVKSVLATQFTNGAAATMALMSGTDKQLFSAFTGIADIRADAPGRKQATIIAGADVYVGDFQNISLKAHQYGLTRDVLFYDPEYIKVGTLRGVATEDLAKTGDSDRFMITMEKTICVMNEKAIAVVADVN